MITGVILKEPINGYNKIEIITQEYFVGLYKATYAVFDGGNSEIIEQSGLTLKEGMTEADYHRELRKRNKGRIWKAIPETLPEKTKKRMENNEFWNRWQRTRKTLIKLIHKWIIHSFNLAVNIMSNIIKCSKMKTTTKIIFGVFLLVLLTLTSCREVPTSKPPDKPELSINIPLNEVTIDYLLNNGWELAFKNKLYYPVQQDSGMMFIFMPKDERYKCSTFIFHICNGDTIGIHYVGSKNIKIKDPNDK